MRTVFDEIVGLFVDDGFLALALIAWVAAIGLASVEITALRPALGPALLIGCACILLATVLRAGRAKSGQAK